MQAQTLAIFAGGVLLWFALSFVTKTWTKQWIAGALAGLIIVGRVGVLTSELGFGFEFTVITAVVLGGTSLFGGRGSILGSMLGALLLTTIQNGLNLIGADPYLYDVVRGLVLMVAVSIDTLTTRLSRRQRASPV